ncbi:hypothetical protein, partial [Mycoplasma wenyonii]|uniref:hypothetical protein n=1 Tax=Mycoplasma wenyonii TaxID=65123 RepID=UPI001C658735
LQSHETESVMQVSSDLTDLQGIKLGTQCNFKGEEVDKSWKIQCQTKESEKNKDILLTPLVIK